MSDLTTVVIVTALAGLATGIGAIPLLFRTRVSHRTYDAALGLAAGVMCAAAVFGLIVPGLEAGTLRAVIVGVFVGGVAILIANRLLPHLHPTFAGVESHAVQPELGGEASPIRRAVLIGGAIVLHNAPEGLAIGVAFAAGLDEVAYLLAIIIAIQNIPDGFAFAVPIGETNIPTPWILVLTGLSGLVPQVAAAVLGYGLVALAQGVFPFAAGFAAGAMLGVIFREMIPSSHGHGHADAATAAFLIGFCLLVVVDVGLSL